MDTPKPVPPYPFDQVRPAWYYCLHCRRGESTEAGIKQHIVMSHGFGDMLLVVLGEDYTNGTHLKILADRWDAWSLSAIDRFHNQVESLRGADDFELEVGNGLPE